MKELLRGLFSSGAKNNVQKSESIVVVSGLPRSGTSMMMKTLEAGGLETFIDNIRVADDDNPKGYYELERVKQLDKGDTEWLPEAQGKVVKVISALLKHLPSDHQYKVVFMHRNMDEILASQKKMLINRGEDPNKASDEELTELFKKHKASVANWLHTQPNVDVLDIHYSQFLADPQQDVQRINAFFGWSTQC
ncbi:sulfotransferase [Chloroflexi bacterium TSY]|nr:sulfotransferase [Chloroflexi bacterium TSY]